MKYSHLFGKTKRDAPADADSVNAALLSQGGFVDKQMAGVYNFLPLGLRVLKKIQNIIREEMDAVGGNEILMPALTQIENYEKTGRSDLDILFHTMGHNETKYVLNQSHEEVVTPLVQRFSFSYRDFPMAVYQLQNKFRNEPRAKSGVLRGREFNMKDMYSFHATEENLNEYYEKVKEAYFKVYNRLGIGDITVIAYASGGSFSKYSHEFQTLCDIGEDTVHLCEKCRIGINKEIIEEQKNCPGCGNTELVARKSIEVGNIFKLRTRFSDAFEFTYTDEKGQKQKVEMGCYGIGPSRLLGTLVEVFHDTKGIVWPEAVAPYKLHVVSLGNQPEVLAAAQQLYTQLSERKAEVLFDDRDESIGAKLADADLIGIPWRLVVSKKSLEKGGVELKGRNSSEAKIISMEECLALC
ncbi:hypothetical protein KBD59_05400 [Candidatus Gracilibacteria bacterium]|nr:hypothetical protein [Candidatus Gracilibacteria bacterium]